MAIDPKAFAQPDRQYAIYPIIHGAVEQEKDRAEKLYALGFAGVVGSVPYTRNFPENEQEWQSTADGFRRYFEHGMKTWIYDEKGYPSGTAGGVVIDAHPEYEAVGLYCYEYWRTLDGPMPYRADVPGDRLFKAMLLPLNGGEAIDITDTQNDRGTLHFEVPEGAYHLFMMSSRRLFDGTHAAHSYSEPRNYINLLDKDAARAFISVTHENYARVLGDEFGKGVRAFFTDEPSLISWCITATPYPIVPWHRDFPQNFAKKYGYPVELAVVAVVTGRGPECAKRRCDFWQFVADTVADSYFGELRRWCNAHGLHSSGHMLCEERLSWHVYNYGSLYRCAREMDWPGIDQLESEPDKLMNPAELPVARLLASFADVYGSGESFTEFSDHWSRMANRQIGINWVYGSVNWHFAMGINNMTAYYNFANYSDDEVRALNTYTARLGYLMRQGKRDSRVALLYPEASIWAAYTPSGLERAEDTSALTRRIEETFANVSWQLLNRQIDFDYVDEDLLEEAGIIGGRLCYRDRAYETVVFPACHCLRQKTVEKMKALLEAGIGVVLVGGLPEISRDTGADGAFGKLLAGVMTNPKLTVIPITEGWQLPGKCVCPALARPVTVTPRDMASVLVGAEGFVRYVDGEILSKSILSHARVLEDGSRLVLLTNMGCAVYRGTLRIEGAGTTVTVFTPEDGKAAPAICNQADGAAQTDFTLRPYEAKIFYFQ